MQRRVGVVDRRFRLKAPTAGDADSVLHEGRGSDDALGRQEVERTTVVVLAPAAPPLGRLEQLSTHDVPRSRSLTQWRTTPRGYSMRSGWNLLVTPRTYAAALERTAHVRRALERRG